MLDRALSNLIAEQWAQERKLLAGEKPYSEQFLTLKVPVLTFLTSDVGQAPSPNACLIEDIA